MFDEIIREVEKLSKPRQMSISVPLDDKGFYDRLCPNPECGGSFKVLFSDWGEKVSDAVAFCPFCRHEAASDQWHTPEQAEHIRSAALAEMSRLFQGALKRGVARSRPMQMGGGMLKMSMSLSYSPGRIPAVVPALASDELRQEFTCEKCACRFASLGASFFCPACGHNSASSCFDNTLQTVVKTVTALGPLRTTLEQTVDPDAAKDAVRQLLEDQFARMVGAFERLNEALFDQLPNAAQFPRKGSVFQRLDDASNLWLSASGKAYGDFLPPTDLTRMKLLFQRRHVFSHRQGIVDQPYISRSGDTGYAVGQRLVVRDADVLELATLLRILACGLRTLCPPMPPPITIAPPVT
ncbi:MAG: hypothetical protein JWN24_1685 [Phycisphaerales bacterium]|nr:hypothetical protein [Phycisphaerales bacterium]